MSAIQKATANEAITKLLAQRNYRDAIAILQQQLAEQENGENYARLALAYFQAEKYEEAAAQYIQALLYDGNNLEWRAMLALAQFNLITERSAPALDFDDLEDDELPTHRVVPSVYGFGYSSRRLHQILHRL